MNYLGAEPTSYRREIHYFLLEYVLIEECAPSKLTCGHIFKNCKLAGRSSVALLRDRMPANYPTIALVMLTNPDNVFLSGL